MNEKILVLGSSGQLGQEIRHLAGFSARFVFANRTDFDALKHSSVTNLISRVKPNAVINAVAYAKFDLAEAEVEACRAINVDFVACLAEASRQHKFHLVHYSSDYVYDGTKASPYLETDQTRPLSVYGRSKIDGEKAIFELAQSAAIVRTSWLYSRSGHNFLKTMLRLSSEGNPIRVVDDQTGSPTWTQDLARVSIEHFAKPTGSVELYHYAGKGEATWCEFANAIFEIWGVEARAQPISTSEFPAAGARPKFSVLSVEKFEKTFGREVPSWRESLAQCRSKWDI